jgi:replication factor C subunit 1
MNIVISGNLTGSQIPNNSKIHKVLRPGHKLYIGSECNDGRPITESWRYKQAIKLGIPIIKRPQIAKVGEVGEDKEMFVDKYTPKKVSDIIGHKEQINQITNWLTNWDEAEYRGLLITGPPGIGKTTTVHLIAQSLGFKVTEYNASDTRSISVLRGLIALGIKRLIKEIIVMDEIDGLSERGGVGELAAIIKKTNVPIICIANEKPPKLKPIINACFDIKFNRPVKSTIATALLKVANAEGIEVTKADLEGLCEKNGNDIRSILNTLEFHRSDIDSKNDKDSTLRLDLFSATGRLIGNKKLSIDDASNLVFVDYNMIPLMVQEAYIGSSRESLDDILRASDYISYGDILNKRIHQKHDWSLLPSFVNCTVAAAKAVSGPAPFQIFPAWLGKNSKRLKHTRYVDNLSSKVFCSNSDFRLDYADTLQTIALGPLGGSSPDIKQCIKVLDGLRFTRDDVMEQLMEIVFDKIEIPTKTKTAFTREYNKTHCDVKTKNVRKRKLEEIEEGEDEDDGEGEGGEGLGELENELGLLEI